MLVKPGAAGSLEHPTTHVSGRPVIGSDGTTLRYSAFTRSLGERASFLGERIIRHNSKIFRQRPSTGPIVSGIPGLSDMEYFKEPSGVKLSLSSYISSALYGIPEPIRNLATQAHSFTRGCSPASVCRIEPGPQSVFKEGRAAAGDSAPVPYTRCSCTYIHRPLGWSWLRGSRSRSTASAGA
jgi:hypothetical protein